MKRSVLLCMVLAMLLSACSPRPVQTGASAPVSGRQLTVFAAASLTDAFQEIAGSFEASHSGLTVALSFAGSQTLRTQIEQGAQPDVFASANTKEMNTLVAGGFVEASAPRVFLTNRLVVILPADNPASLSSLQDLASPGLKLVLAAEDVPAGSYARQALGLMDARFGSGYKERVLANVASNEEDVKQVVAKVQLGEADAGIVYTSDAMAARLRSIPIPAEFNVIAKYPIAALARSSNAELAREFVAYVLSPDGQSILEKWGFSPAG